MNGRKLGLDLVKNSLGRFFFALVISKEQVRHLFSQTLHQDDIGQSRHQDMSSTPTDTTTTRVPRLIKLLTYTKQRA